MAARDRYTHEAVCPKCGHSGTVKLSEDDHPYMRDPGLSIDALPEGFTTPNDYPVYHGKARVACRCGHEFQLLPGFPNRQY